MKKFFLLLTVGCFITPKVYAELPIPEEDLRRFIEKIRSCEVYVLEFKHPLTGEMNAKTIKGIQDNKCVYLETMPEGLSLNCNFPMDSLSSIAGDYEKAIDDIKSGTPEKDEEMSSLERMMNDPEVCTILDPEKENIETEAAPEEEVKDSAEDV